MIYYLLAAVIPLVVMVFDRPQENTIEDKKCSKFGVFFAVLPMALLYALRYERVGVDTIGYVRAFKDMGRFTFEECLSGKERFEKGFLLYEKIISLFTESYTVYFLITAIIMFGVLARFAYKYAGNPYIFLFLFVTLGTYNFYMTGMRQALAITICLLAFDFVVRKKLIRFVLFVLLAAQFHKSAMVFMVVYPLCLFKTIPFSVVSYSVVTTGILASFAAFNSFINEFLDYDYSIEETGNGQIFLALVIIFAIYGLINIKAIKEKTQSALPILHLSFITVMLWVLRLVSRAMERPSFYFICGLYALVSLSYEYSKEEYKDLANIAIICVSLLLFLIRGGGGYYSFFWQ